MTKTEDEEIINQQQDWQIHLAEEEICPKNRSHPCPGVLICRLIAVTPMSLEWVMLGVFDGFAHLMASTETARRKLCACRPAV